MLRGSANIQAKEAPKLCLERSLAGRLKKILGSNETLMSRERRWQKDKDISWVIVAKRINQ